MLGISSTAQQVRFQPRLPPSFYYTMPAARTENTTGEHPDACFFYGTLMFPSIISRLLRRPISDPSLAQEAHLPGYVRLHIRERDYPAIVPIDEARTHFSSNKEFLEVLHKEDGVKGVVVTGLSGKEVALLDEWEADEYVKRVVTASVGPKGEEVRLWAYQWAIDEYGELLLPQIWHFDAFVYV